MTPTGTRILLTITALTAAVIIAAIPATRTWVAHHLDRLRSPTPRARRWTALAAFAIAVAYLYLTALGQDRQFILKFHDEHMHLLQMRMLAEGRLWLPQHPLADFFETFHVIVKPVYASIYWPGTALLYVPTIWLNLPYWLGPLLVAGASVALFYRIVTELIDGVAGLLAALMLISLDTFRFLSLALMSHGVIIAMGLAIVWAYLRWRDGYRFRWAIVAGVFAGWAAITRPIDAIVFTLPVAIAVLIELRSMTMIVATLAAALFVALQLIENIGVTGRLLESPYQMYARQDSPNLAMGFGGIDVNARPQSTLPQKQLFYERFLLPEIERHTLASVPATWLRERIPLLIHVTLPNVLLLVLLPFSVFALKQRRWVLWLMWPTYCLLYVPFPFLLRHYAVVAAPSLLFGVLLGKHAVESMISASQRAVASVFLTIAIALLAIVALPEIDREVIDDGYLRPTMWFVAKEMPRHVQPPAIVLFRFAPGDDFHEEPVYNVDAARIDDAPIIRAHDLGIDRDRQLFDYYAQRQPQREVYLYERATRTLTRLGNVAELSRRLPATGTTR